MKRYLIIVLVATLVLTSRLMVGCGSSERDEAVAFYKEAYPIATEMKQVVDDWDSFLQQFSQRKVTNQEILKVSQEYTTRLEVLPEDLSMIYAPPPLRQLKDDMASALNLGIEAFSLYQMLAQTYDISYAQKADQKLLECNRLMMRIADEWDDGLAHYEIKLSEILP